MNKVYENFKGLKFCTICYWISTKLNHKEKIFLKSSNIWKSSNTYLNNTKVKEEITRKIKYFELNNNENKTTKFVYSSNLSSAQEENSSFVYFRKEKKN